MIPAYQKCLTGSGARGRRFTDVPVDVTFDGPWSYGSLELKGPDAYIRHSDATIVITSSTASGNHNPCFLDFISDKMTTTTTYGTASPTHNILLYFLAM